MEEDKWGIRKMSDEDLYGFIAGWKPNSPGYIAGMQELRRRNDAPANLRSWIAITISLVALIVSIVTLVKKW